MRWKVADMFILIKKLREKDEEIESLHDEIKLILQREAGVIDAYHSAEKAAIAAKAEAQELKNKYSALYERYLNLLERYEKALKDAPAADVVEVPESGIGDLSDGYHTFNELYHHRAMLFSVICNIFRKRAWKSKLHDTGDMYEGMFIVGIDTPYGQATYHYDIDPYWDMFKVKELDKAPKWDGHTSEEAIARIAALAEIDVAEVMRCRKCNHNVANWNHDENDITDYTDIVCDYFMTDGMAPNDYCSYGERKET